MADNQKHGGVAIKFEAAYFRTLYFRDPPRDQAEALYNKYRAGGVPTDEEYRTFQDYIFRVMVDQAGKLHLPMHFHTCVGIGDYFSLRNGNVLNKENVLRDSRYKNVTFVLVHGGWPYEREAALLTAVKNVYLDTSFQSEMLYPSQFKMVLKQLLTIYPDKLMFGSDAFPFNDALVPRRVSGWPPAPHAQLWPQRSLTLWKKAPSAKLRHWNWRATTCTITLRASMET